MSHFQKKFPNATLSCHSRHLGNFFESVAYWEFWFQNVVVWSKSLVPIVLGKYRHIMKGREVVTLSYKLLSPISSKSGRQTESYSILRLLLESLYYFYL
jgi:hypothetical protein